VLAGLVLDPGVDLQAMPGAIDVEIAEIDVGQVDVVAGAVEAVGEALVESRSC
jgi:hypothetical protein